MLRISVQTQLATVSAEKFSQKCEFLLDCEDWAQRGRGAGGCVGGLGDGDRVSKYSCGWVS